MARVFFSRNDNLLRLVGVKNNATGLTLNAATVTATVKTQGGTPVPGAAWPVTLAYVAGSAGDYEAVLPAGLAVSAGREYTAEIKATNAGVTGFWSFAFSVVNRTG